MTLTIAILRRGPSHGLPHMKVLELLKTLHNVVEIYVDDIIVEKLKKANADLAMVLPLSPFEDNCIRGTLDLLGIKYLYSGILAFGITQDKYLCKHIFQSIGIDAPKGYVISRQDVLENNIKIDYPYVIKPIDGYGSIGVYVIFSHDDYLKLKDDTSDIREEMIVEEFIPGIELTTAVLMDEAVGTAEMRMKKHFFDRETKLNPDLVEYIFPAKVPEKIYRTTLEFALKAHRFLGCKTISRTDFRYDPMGDRLSILEINLQPDLGERSSFEKILKSTKGIDSKDIVNIIVEDTLQQKSSKPDYTKLPNHFTSAL